MKLKKETIEFIKLLLEYELRQEVATGSTLGETYTKDLLDAYEDFMMANNKTTIDVIIANERIDSIKNMLKENEE